MVNKTLAFTITFDNVVLQSDKKIGESINSIFSLNFNNKEVNALEQIFGMINKAYKSMGGGSSM